MIPRYAALGILPSSLHVPGSSGCLVLHESEPSSNWTWDMLRTGLVKMNGDDVHQVKIDAQLPCLAYAPCINPPFGDCAMYFDNGVDIA